MFAVVMSSTMALTGMGVSMVPTFAADSTTTTSITVNNAVKGAKYKIYKLANGSFQSNDSNKMGDIVVNTAYRDTVVSVLQKHDTSFKLDTSASTKEQDNAIMKAISGLGDKKQKFANDLAKALDGTEATYTDTATDGSFKQDNMEDGYYLIMSDTSDTTYTTDGNSMTSAILYPIHGAKTVNSKSSTPTLKKSVEDTSSTAWDKDYNKSADAGLIDSKIDGLRYKLTGTVASNIADFDTYQYEFRDTLPKGLSVTKAELDKDWGVTIKAQGKNASGGDIDADISSAFTSSVTDATTTAGSTIKWSASDLKVALKTAGFTDTTMKDAKVIVTYKPVYDSTDINQMYASASKLSEPDVNTADLSFSNNPYSGGTGSTSKTPEDQNKVYDYNLVIHKIGEDKAAITGAKFTLTDANGKTVGKDLTADDNGTFTFVGLDSDTEYTITETTVPHGYKHIDPIKFKITSTPNDEKTEVTSISASETSDTSNAATLSVSDATVNAEIVNIEGPDMPLTGRQGIMLGLVVGGIIVSISLIEINKNKKDA